MTTLDRSIFRKYDIRGTATGDAPQLTPGVALLVGKALGTFLPRQFNSQRVFVGSDNRITSGTLKGGSYRRFGLLWNACDRYRRSVDADRLLRLSLLRW